jgi:predicted MFS family arabinose efflux permease
MHPASPGWLARRRVALGAVLVGQVVSAFEGTVVTSAMPTIVRDLGGMAAYGWVFSSFLVASTVAVLVCGKLADAFGRLPVFLGGMGLFLVGSCLCGSATSFGGLVAFRVVQGLGAGALVPIAMTISADLYTLAERAKVQALLTSTWGAANVLGPLIGGWIVLHMSWRWVFLVNVPVGALAAGLLAVSYRDPPRRALGPLFDVPVREPAVRAGLIGAGFAGGIIYACTAYVPLWVAGQGRGDALAAGAALVPLLVGWAVGSSFGVRVLIARGMRETITGSFVIVLVAAVVLTMAVSAGGAGPWAMAALAVMGLGIGPAASISLLGPQTAVSWTQRGSVTSAVYAVRMFGGSMVVALLGELGGSSREASVGRFAAVAVLAAGGALTAARLAPRVLRVSGARGPGSVESEGDEVVEVASRDGAVADGPRVEHLEAAAILARVVDHRQ